MKDYGFIPSEPKLGDYIHGDGALGDVATNPGGQWDSWLPQPEAQNRGFETYSCVSEATSHCTEILQRKKYGDVTDYSVRFLATMSGTGPKKGNDNNTVAETLRKGGCVVENDWPFGVSTYDAFYTKPYPSVVQLAKSQFADNSFGHSWIANTSPESLKEALTYSPLALSVYAWDTPDANGIYHRPKGFKDNHAICVYGYKENEYWKVFDSYAPFEKKLAWDFGFGIGKRFTLDRVIPISPNPNGWVNWVTFINYCKRLLGL